MSIASLYRHTLAVVRSIPGATLDSEGADLGMGTPTESVSGSFSGLIQPRSARERADPLGTGPNVGNFRIYCPVRDLGPDDVIRKSGSPDADLNGDYRVLFVGNAAGQGHHLEIDADRLVPTPTTAV